MSDKMVKREGGEVAENTTAHIILQAVKDPAVDPAKLRELLAVQREWQADQSRAAFNSAVTRFQHAAPIVAKLDMAHNKKYSRMDRIWREIRPLIQECGLSVTWERVDLQDGMCVLSGHLRHADGHSEPIGYMLPLPDALSGQNAAQRFGSATTYAKRYATCAVLGIQTGEDDDGNAAGGGSGATVTEDQAARLAELCEATGTDKAKLCGWAGCQTLGDFPAAKYEEAMRTLKAREKGGRR